MARQILHIFRKDLRHHWPEATIGTALLVTFVWLEPTEWGGALAPSELQTLEGFVTTLLPISWALLIVRLVQDENLVGDRQYWITRPYAWKALLAEKILFVAAAISLPMFVGQLVLLKMAGFRPEAYIGAVVVLQLMWLAFLVLPAMALAAITSGVGQAVVVVLGTMVCVIAVAIAEIRPTRVHLPRQETFAGWIPVIAGLGAAAGIVVWQYARRRTWRARLALIGAIVVAALVLPPLMPRRSVANAYPYLGAAGASPVQLAFDTQKRELGMAVAEKKTVDVRLPVVIAGISDGSVVHIDGAKLAVSAPGGREWHSGWRPGGRYFANARGAFLDFSIERTFYEQVKNMPINATVTAALAIYREPQPAQVIAKEGGFGVPGNGRCVLEGSGEMFCLFPMKVRSMLVTIQSDGMRCPLPERANPLPPGLTGYALTRMDDGSIADFGISPVQTQQLFSWDWEFGQRGRYAPGGICPGTPLRFGFVSQTGGARMDVHANGIRLADYTPKLAPRGGGTAGFSFGVW